MTEQQIKAAVRARDAFVLEGEPPVALSPVEVKALVRHRDGYRCTECGISATEHVLLFGQTLDVHRLTPGSDYALDGCVTLCRKCHGPQPKSPKGDGPNDRLNRCIDQDLREEFGRLSKALDIDETTLLETALHLLLQHFGWRKGPDKLWLTLRPPPPAPGG